MDIIIAIAHIAGSLVTLSVLNFIWMIVASWEQDYLQKKNDEQASLELGIRQEDLGLEENQLRLLKLLVDRFSPELLKNRISDLCGTILFTWKWLGSIVIILVIAFVLWNTFAYELKNAAFAWSIVFIAIFFSITTVFLSYLCKLLTGRFPGQAKTARKLAAEWSQNNGELLRKTTTVE